MLPFVLLLAFQSPAVGVRAETPRISRCEQLAAESLELRRSNPQACDEARDTQRGFVSAFPAVLELCHRLERETQAGAAKLQLGTEDEMQREALEIRQRHMNERREQSERITRELLPTALDRNDPNRPPPQVGSECGSEVEEFVRFRRAALRALNEFYNRLEQLDETLFEQARERALPRPTKPATASPAQGATPPAIR